MAKTPSSEETAKAILSIFVSRFKNRAGHVLSDGNFNAVWREYDLQAEDFKPGMEYAVSQGWVEVTDNGSYKLTQAGYDAA